MEVHFGSISGVALFALFKQILRMLGIPSRILKIFKIFRLNVGHSFTLHFYFYIFYSVDLRHRASWDYFKSCIRTRQVDIIFNRS